MQLRQLQAVQAQHFKSASKLNKLSAPYKEAKRNELLDRRLVANAHAQYDAATAATAACRQ
jgi:hypothetical protein